jgi:hypothetical protein
MTYRLLGGSLSLLLPESDFFDDAQKINRLVGHTARGVLRPTGFLLQGWWLRPTS